MALAECVVISRCFQRSDSLEGVVLIGVIGGEAQIDDDRLSKLQGSSRREAKA